MKHNTQSMCILTIIILLLACFAEHAAALGADPGTTFTYQGRLLTGGAPLDGTADLEFRMFSSAGAGVQIGNTLVFNDHPITDGFFTAQLNFSAPELLFRADARWLEIAVNGTTLSPRQRIGMIAQDVEAVFPDWVEEFGDGYKTVTYRGFEALTVEALRELHTENQVLHDENEELRARLEAIEQQLATMATSAKGAAR